MSRTTAKKYLSRLKESGIPFEQILSLSDKDLNELLQERPVVIEDERRQVLEKLLALYCKRLKRKGITREILFKEYKQKYPEGYTLSSFCFYLCRYHETNNVVMHLEYKAGDKLFINFAGKKLSILDKESGDIIPVEVFVTILPCSQLI